MYTVSRNIQTPQNLFDNPCHIFYMKHVRFEYHELALAILIVVSAAHYMNFIFPFLHFIAVCFKFQISSAITVEINK